VVLHVLLAQEVLVEPHLSVAMLNLMAAAQEMLERLANQLLVLVVVLFITLVDPHATYLLVECLHILVALIAVIFLFMALAALEVFQKIV